MSSLNKVFKTDKKLLSIYFTAGYPALEDTVPIIRALANSGVDMIEIGLPFSDPLADGPTIQQSSTKALKNGMSSALLFEQLGSIRKEVDIPLIVMGYFNPVLQYGVEAFCAKCSAIGIDGLILPDLPLEEYRRHYKAIFDRFGLKMIFLITPQTSEERIREIDRYSQGFIYLVSSASTTGAKTGFADTQQAYFKRVSQMGLTNPLIVGFGISNRETFEAATRHTNGAIIGSAFINSLSEHGIGGINSFVNKIRPL
jgi:tryptophan synthase alpha chain